MIGLATVLVVIIIMMEAVDATLPAFCSYGPIRVLGRWLNSATERWAQRRDPTPGEMQYLLRLTELWARERGSWTALSDQSNFHEVFDFHFWQYVRDGESVRVDPETGSPCMPKNWKKIIRELRGRSLQ